MCIYINFLFYIKKKSFIAPLLFEKNRNFVYFKRSRNYNPKKYNIDALFYAYNLFRNINKNYFRKRKLSCSNSNPSRTNHQKTIVIVYAIISSVNSTPPNRFPFNYIRTENNARPSRFLLSIPIRAHPLPQQIDLRKTRNVLLLSHAKLFLYNGF